jgi:hypothetical protein
MDGASVSPSPLWVMAFRPFLRVAAGLFTTGQEIPVTDGVRQVTYTVCAAGVQQGSTDVLIRVRNNVNASPSL